MVKECRAARPIVGWAQVRRNAQRGCKLPIVDDFKDVGPEFGGEGGEVGRRLGGFGGKGEGEDGGGFRGWKGHGEGCVVGRRWCVDPGDGVEIGAVGEVVHGKAEGELALVAVGGKGAEAEEQDHFLAGETEVGADYGFLGIVSGGREGAMGGGGRYLELFAVHRSYVNVAVAVAGHVGSGVRNLRGKAF